MKKLFTLCFLLLVSNFLSAQKVALNITDKKNIFIHSIQDEKVFVIGNFEPITSESVRFQAYITDENLMPIKEHAFNIMLTKDQEILGISHGVDKLSLFVSSVAKSMKGSGIDIHSISYQTGEYMLQSGIELASKKHKLINYFGNGKAVYAIYQHKSEGFVLANLNATHEPRLLTTLDIQKIAGKAPNMEGFKSSNFSTYLDFADAYYSRKAYPQGNDILYLTYDLASDTKTRTEVLKIDFDQIKIDHIMAFEEDREMFSYPRSILRADQLTTLIAKEDRLVLQALDIKNPELVTSWSRKLHASEMGLMVNSLENLNSINQKVDYTPFNTGIHEAFFGRFRSNRHFRTVGFIEVDENQKPKAMIGSLVETIDHSPSSGIYPVGAGSTSSNPTSYFSGFHYLNQSLEETSMKSEKVDASIYDNYIKEKTKIINAHGPDLIFGFDMPKEIKIVYYDKDQKVLSFSSVSKMENIKLATKQP
ncbi:hypothetical protein [Pararhodonellum marinum]|uniref:hypothetical protein n=1 Tax=Pararhodonellum marinum TaxID=2755358 RepID=UPI00188E3D97|nr:hypothetical protein [Pararhodonellum marinum]